MEGVAVGRQGALGERDANHQKRSHERQIKAGGFAAEPEDASSLEGSQS